MARCILEALDADMVCRVLRTLSSTGDMTRVLLTSKEMMPLMEEALRQRAKANGLVLPPALPEFERSWCQYLLWLYRRTSPSVQIAMGYQCAAVVDQHGRLLTFGCVGEEGILGHGSTISIAAPKVVKMPYTCCRVHSISMGIAHTLLRTDAGTLSFGIGKHGRLGHGHTMTVHAPRRIESLQDCRVSSVAAGGSHSLVLMDDGTAYSFGYGRNGQLGIGSRKDQLIAGSINNKVTSGRSCWTAVAAGNHHSLGLSDDGVLWSFGRGFKGRLGHGHANADATRPTSVDALRGQRVTAIAAGDMHSVVATDAGACYSFGDNSAGQLGYGDTVGQLLPQHILALPQVPIKELAAGNSHSVVLTQSGRVYVFGCIPPVTAIPSAHEPADVQTLARPREMCHETNVISIGADDGVAACTMSDGRAFCMGSGWHWLGCQLAQVYTDDRLGSYNYRAKVLTPGDGSSLHIFVWE